MLALGLYLALGVRHARELGVVGEVAISWALDRPPAVLAEVDPPIWADGAASPTAGHRAGPLVASQVRPLERLQIGSFSLPIAVNRYTGGPPDWPARLAWLLTGSRAAVAGVHLALGALLLALVHRFLRYRASDIAAAIAALILATDWSFLFYKRALGGTEILLQAAFLLCLWALWSRRWGGGRHGLLALGAGLGLGLMAKLTFAVSFAALAGAALLTRWDRPPLRPPLPSGLWKPFLAVAVLTAPLWIAALHHQWVPADPHIRSHDFPDLQARRVLSFLEFDGAPAREGAANLAFWAGDPVGFFARAYGAPYEGGLSPWRALGWLLVAGGAALGWRDRHPTPASALLRFVSVLLPLQVGLLWLVARDMHHLAMATPTLAILAGLALEHLCALATPPRSFARARLALLLCLPWMIAGSRAILATDAVLAGAPVPTFTERGQRQIVQLLRENGVTRLVACDYELYGVLEIRAPEIAVVHGWGAASRERWDILPDLLAQAAGGHLLAVEASAPMIYNLQFTRPKLHAAAAAAGLFVEEVARLPDGSAVLYSVEAQR